MKRKIIIFLLSLCCSPLALSEVPHFLWDNQAGAISQGNCSIQKIAKSNFNLSRHFGRGKNVFQNMESYDGVTQSLLLNYSMVKTVSGKPRAGYEHIEVVGVNSNASVKPNRWFSERGDQGYIKQNSLVPLEGFVFDINPSQVNLKKEFSNRNFISLVPGFDLTKSVYLALAADNTYYSLSCERGPRRDYLVFRAYQKGHGDKPLFLIGVSVDETSLFKSFGAIRKTEARSFISDLENERMLVEGMESKASVSQSPPRENYEDFIEELIHRYSKSDNRPADEPLIPPLQKVICSNAQTVNVRDLTLKYVLFEAEVGESVQVFQGFNAVEVKTVINGVEYTFHKVLFPHREDKYARIGYVASPFIKAPGDCIKPAKSNVVKKPITGLEIPVTHTKRTASQITGLNDSRCCDFPTAKKPALNYTSGFRQFGAERVPGRIHGGCDLYRSKDEPVISVAPGKVIRGLYYFFQGTYALEVVHSGGFVVRYAEVSGYQAPGVKVGALVNMGQKIAKVGKPKCCEAMLHFELYSGYASGSLTRRSGPYYRRNDLMNPTRYLQKWEAGAF